MKSGNGEWVIGNGELVISRVRTAHPTKIIKNQRIAHHTKTIKNPIY